MHATERREAAGWGMEQSDAKLRDALRELDEDLGKKNGDGVEAGAAERRLWNLAFSPLGEGQLGSALERRRAHTLKMLDGVEGAGERARL